MWFFFVVNSLMLVGNLRIFCLNASTIALPIRDPLIQLELGSEAPPHDNRAVSANTTTTQEQQPPSNLRRLDPSIGGAAAEHESDRLLQISVAITQNQTTGVDSKESQPSRSAVKPTTTTTSNIGASPSTTTSTTARTERTASTKKPTLVITGLVKDAQKHLNKLERGIRRVTDNAFQLEHLIFYENDSTDDSVEMLNTWRTWAKNMTIISEKNVSIPQRTDRLAHGRNLVMRELLNLPNIDDIDYLLILDMDEVNYHLSNVAQCLNLPPGFGVCCANQYKVYYDLWALRTFDSWLAFDLWKSPLSLRVVVNDKYRHIPASADPIPVRSCFGGAALYNVSAIKHLPLDTMYRGTEIDRFDPDKKYPGCEHVPFHEELQRNVPNYTLMIQPRFLNDGPSDEYAPIFRARKKRKEEYLESWNDPRSKEFYKGRTT